MQGYGKTLLHQRCSERQKIICAHMFYEVVVLESFTKSTGKQLCWSHFLIKLQA